MSFRKKPANRLKHFIYDGVGASVCDGFAESNFNAYASALSATGGQISFLSSVQSLTGCYLQLWSEKLVRIFGSPKKLVVTAVGAQVLLLGAMLVHTCRGTSQWPFMALVLAFSVLGGLGGATWNAWVSDLLPGHRRGYCFGIRNQRTYPSQFLALIAAGFLLQKVEQSLGGSGKGTQSAFSLVFALGLSAKIFSWSHLYRQPSGHSSLPHSSLGPVKLLGLACRDEHYRNLVLFFAAMGFAVNLSGPYQTPYVLQVLKLGYFPFAAITATLVISRFLVGPWIGRVIDRIGHARPLMISSFLMPLIPMGWAISSSIVGIILTQLFAGVVWTAFDLSVFGLLIESVPADQKQRAFSLKHIAWNLASGAGAMVGALLIASPEFFSPQAVFWASGLSRGAAAVLALRVLGASGVGSFAFPSVLKPAFPLRLKRKRL